MHAPAAAHTRLCAAPLPLVGRRPTNAPPHRPARTPAPRLPLPPPSATASPSRPSRPAPTNVEYDAVIVGGGFGGLTVASQLAAAGRSVVVLEAFIIPGGSGGHFESNGCTFDVGASMMFGLGAHGTTNLITRALAAVGKEVATVPDPTQIHYHLPPSTAHPSGLEVQVWRSYDEFVKELVSKFPHEEAGIKKFYGECWRVFDSLNALDLKSLEEPRYLLGGECVCVCEVCGRGKEVLVVFGGWAEGVLEDGKTGCRHTDSPPTCPSQKTQSLSSALSPVSPLPPSWPPTRATWQGATSRMRNC